MGEHINFTAQCPNCELETPQGPISKTSLKQLAQDNSLKFRCGSCNHEWDPSAVELENIRELI